MKSNLMMVLFFATLAMIAATGHERWQAVQGQQDHIEVDAWSR